MIDTNYDNLNYYELCNSYHACRQAFDHYLSRGSSPNSIDNLINIREELKLEDQINLERIIEVQV